MIILLKKDAEQSQVDNLLTLLRMKNITPSVSVGQMQTLIGCVGDVTHIDPGLIEALDVVESVQRIQEPYKAANRKFHPDISAERPGCKAKPFCHLAAKISCRCG